MNVDLNGNSMQIVCKQKTHEVYTAWVFYFESLTYNDFRLSDLVRIQT